MVYYLRKAAGMPLPVLFRKVRARLAACGKTRAKRYKALFVATYAGQSPGLAPAALGRLRLTGCAKEVTALADLYCEHYFDLLGSGWVKVEMGMTARGLEGHRYRGGTAVPRINRSNARTSARIAARLSENYRPIDWQIDFREPLSTPWQNPCHPWRVLHLAVPGLRRRSAGYFSGIPRCRRSP